MSGRHSGNPESVPNGPYDVAAQALPARGETLTVATQPDVSAAHVMETPRLLDAGIFGRCRPRFADALQGAPRVGRNAATHLNIPGVLRARPGDEVVLAASAGLLDQPLD